MRSSAKIDELDIIEDYSVDKVFIDHTFLDALIDEDNENHSKAELVVNKIKKLIYIPGLYLNTGVFTRVVTKRLREKGKVTAEKTAKSIKASEILKILMINNDLFDETIDYFLNAKYREYEWEFLDWINFVMMKQNDIKFILAFHKHADQAQRLFNFTVIRVTA